MTDQLSAVIQRGQMQTRVMGLFVKADVALAMASSRDLSCHRQDPRCVGAYRGTYPSSVRFGRGQNPNINCFSHHFPIAAEVVES